MFTFDNGILFVESASELVNKLRALAAFESTSDKVQLQAIDVQMGDGIHKAVGMASKGQPLVLYFREEKVAEVPAPVEEVKTEEVKDVQAEANSTN